MMEQGLASTLVNKEKEDESLIKKLAELVKVKPVQPVVKTVGGIRG